MPKAHTMPRLLAYSLCVRSQERGAGRPNPNPNPHPNQERGAGRRFTRAECESALKASGSRVWAAGCGPLEPYPENPQDWLGAQQLLKVRVRVTVTVRVS